MIEIMIPKWQVPSQNRRENGGVACKIDNWREGKRLTSILKYTTRAQDKADGPRHVMITTFRKVLIRDYANLVGGAKTLCDSLVKAGLLVDDNIKMMTAEYLQYKASDYSYGICTFIHITEGLQPQPKVPSHWPREWIKQ